jgi:peroxiredoxin
MNLIKSIYLVVYIATALCGISLFALYQLWLNGLNLAWVGAALTTLPFGLRLSVMMLLRHEARTSRRLPLILSLASLGTALTIMFNQPSGLATILALYGLGGLLIYIFWYSELSRSKNKNLENQQPLPEFVVENSLGEVINSQSFIGKANLILFYRGNWCPLCMAQIKEIAEQYRQLHNSGVNVLLISPQPHKHTQQLADKFDVPFQFLVDSDNKAAKVLDIAMENGLPVGMQVLGYHSDTVYPTVIITNPQGNIIYTDQTDNYRVRPEPQTFIEVLRQHQLID